MGAAQTTGTTTIGAGAGEVVAAGAAGGVTGGIGERAVETGSMSAAIEEPEQIALDGAFGAGGAALGAAGKAIVNEVAGGAVKQAETKLAKISRPGTTARRLQNARAALSEAQENLKAKTEAAGAAGDAAGEAARQRQDSKHADAGHQI